VSEDKLRLDGTRTKWIVLTGAPAAGKSTIIAGLKERRVRVVSELARAEMAHVDLIESTVDEAAFQEALIRRMWDLENTLSPNEVVVFDRGLPDGIGFLKYAGLESSWVTKLCYTHRYNQVILVDRVPAHFVGDDHLRRARAFDPVRLEQCVEEGYRSVGYKPTRLPFMPLANRLEYVMSQAK
jgi:predicted ATPase